MAKLVSERELRRLEPWIPTEPFADVLAMQLVIPLSQSIFLRAMTTAQAPSKTAGKHDGKIVPRLPMKLMFRCSQPFPAVTYSDGVAWLLAVSKTMPESLAHALMQQACWRLSCRVTRGSRERTVLAKRAYAAYRAKWPADEKVQRQPNAGQLADQSATSEGLLNAS